MTFSLLGDEWAYIVLLSDGISSMLSDNEVVGLARDAPDPKTAADRILTFAEELGGEDNATALVVPLAGWGKVQGPDQTKELREYRRRQAGKFSSLPTRLLLMDTRGKRTTTKDVTSNNNCKPYFELYTPTKHLTKFGVRPVRLLVGPNPPPIPSYLRGQLFFG